MQRHAGPTVISLRGFFCGLCDNIVRDLVRVLLALAALLALGPAAELGVGASCAGLGLGLRASEESANVDFVSTVRAFHPANLATYRL